MSYLVRLSLLVLGLGASLSLVWASLYFYAQAPHPAPYQTQLLRSLKGTPPPLYWGVRPDQSPALPTASAFYKEGLWKTLWNGQEAPLQKVLSGFAPDHPLLLMMEAPRTDSLPSLRQLVNDLKRGPMTLFCSRGDGLLQDLRKLEPEWTFCSGEIFMTRFLALDSLRLTGLSRIPGDVFFVHLSHMRLSSSVAGLLAAARQQGRLSVIGPISLGDYQQLHKDYSPDAWWIIPD
jgi:hypothetical protein